MCLQETEPDLNAALLENYNVMLGLYARLGVAPGAMRSTAAQVCVPKNETSITGNTHEYAPCPVGFTRRLDISRIQHGDRVIF